jgi:tetratricopeptide (TPR) repeat protein
LADIFISYTSSDRDWAFWIAKELEALGHTPHIYEWEVNAGADIYAWMQTHMDAADHVLCVMSDQYLKAPFSTLERNAALWQTADKRPGFVLLVAVKPCTIPALSDHIRRCELFGVPEDAARIHFREFMLKREAPETARFPGKVFAVSNIPIRVPEHFMGRDDALAAIETALKRYEGRVAITALHGLRGVGKTTLAATYADRHHEDYRATWWVRAQTPDTMRADLVALGVRLGWIVADEKEEPALAAVMERLRHEGEGILLIYDNAVDANALKPHLPPGGRAQVLVTSNAHAWRGVAEPVEIRLWPKEIGADYLIKRTGRTEERESAVALSEALGGLPLAHEQAAAYCEDLGVSLLEYRSRFEAATIEFLDDKDYAPTEYHPEYESHGDRLTVKSTFQLAIEEAAKRHPAAEPLIVYAALLAPEPIPLFLFSEAGEKFGEPLAFALVGDGLDKVIAALRIFALIDRETIADERKPSITTDCICLHRLVRQVAVARCEGDNRERARHALISALVAVYPVAVFSNPKAWPRARRLDALAIALIGDHASLPQGALEDAAQLFNHLAMYRHGPLADYEHARQLFERALAIREKILSPDDPRTATTLTQLADVVHDQDDLPTARMLHERALAIREKALGPEHPHTAWSLDELARVLQDQGELAQAQSLSERALAIREKVDGPDHPRTATSLHNLGTVLRDRGDLLRARPLFERALSIREKSLGAEHPHSAWSVHSLAGLLEALGDLAGAQQLYNRALEIQETLFGSDHPDIATTLNNLAILNKAQGKVADALPLSERALTIRDKALGPNHPWTKDSARVTADALDALGRSEEAAALRERYGL